MRAQTAFEQAKRRERLRAAAWQGCLYAGLTLGGITMLVPLLWMLSTSLKAATEIFSSTFAWWPRQWIWENYVNAWRAVPFGRFYLNSLCVAACVTVGQIVTSAMAAYAFSRLAFPGRDKLFFAYLATLMIPGSVTMIPVFILMRMIGWVDSYKALIIPAMFTAYGTFMLRQFFMTLPRDLEDAAKIDGCSYWGIFWQIILPLSKPALATLATFTFMGNWASFMWPLIVINDMSKRTLPIGLETFKTMYSTDVTLLMAGSVMAMLPVILVFLFNQRFFIEGIKLTGIKG